MHKVVMLCFGGAIPVGRLADFQLLKRGVSRPPVCGVLGPGPYPFRNGAMWFRSVGLGWVGSGWAGLGWPSIPSRLLIRASSDSFFLDLVDSRKKRRW